MRSFAAVGAEWATNLECTTYLAYSSSGGATTAASMP
jgi:hypothetical protein